MRAHQCCAHLLRYEPTAAPASTCAPLSAKPYADTSANDCSHRVLCLFGATDGDTASMPYYCYAPAPLSLLTWGQSCSMSRPTANSQLR